MAFKKGDMKSRKAKKPHKKKSKVYRGGCKVSCVAAQMAVPSMLVTSSCTDQMFRVTNEKEVHRQYQWHDGFNKDTVPFAWFGSCCPGGLYFTNIYNLHCFLESSEARWVRLVRVPEGEKRFVQDPDTTFGRPVKWRAHCVIAEPRMDLLDKSTWEVLEQHGLFRSIGQEEAKGLLITILNNLNSSGDRGRAVGILSFLLRNFGEESVIRRFIRNDVYLKFNISMVMAILEITWKEDESVVDKTLRYLPLRTFENGKAFRYLTELNKIFGIPFLEIRSKTKQFVKENNEKMPKELGFLRCLYKDIRAAMSANSLESLVQVLHNM